MVSRNDGFAPAGRQRPGIRPILRACACWSPSAAAAHCGKLRARRAAPRAGLRRRAAAPPPPRPSPRPPARATSAATRTTNWCPKAYQCSRESQRDFRACERRFDDGVSLLRVHCSEKQDTSRFRCRKWKSCTEFIKCLQPVAPL
eukprot:1194348-Prorocentrum_minimum.AAC.5